jgi:CRP/FNR family transcriptional regulator, cyclic AMP receptor protein
MSHRLELEREVIRRGLSRSLLFASIDEATLDEMSRHLRRRRFRRNEVIFHQGDPGDSLHVVASGAVKIVLPSPSGEEAIIATLRPGDFFGELALIDGGPHSATAAALEASETLSLPRETFRELLDQHVAVRDAVLHGLANELRRLTGHVEELHFLDLPGRLAARLVRRAREADPAAAGEVSLDWPYTQSDLASMVGGTRQSVNRLLSTLADEGLVRVERDRLIIVDLERLAARAEA